MSKKLTAGQIKAGLSLEQTSSNKFDDVIKVRILFAQIYDTIFEKLSDNNIEQESKRLYEISLDELNGTLNQTIRALTYGKN